MICKEIDSEDLWCVYGKGRIALDFGVSRCDDIIDGVYHSVHRIEMTFY